LEAGILTRQEIVEMVVLGHLLGSAPRRRLFYIIGLGAIFRSVWDERY
jgi:hypothetical protein